MTPDDGNRRNLFRAVIDDLEEQIRTGKLSGGEVLPTAKKLAEQYGMASMTVQRALRDLQERGLTYAVVGKGTYVHPQAAVRLELEDSVGQEEALELNPPVSDRDLNRRMAEYILETDRISAKLLQAFEARDNAAAHQAADELEAHNKANKRLAADLAKYEKDAEQQETTTSASDAKPAKRTARTRKTPK